MMLLSYQNCGKAATSGQSNLPTDGTVHIAPSTQDPAEVKILNQVLDSYTICNQIADASGRTDCEKAALQISAVPAVTSGTVKVAVAASLVCYVVGPKCLVPDSDGSYNSLMRLQACRTNMINQQGYTFESLNSYMQTDPIGYAVTVNKNCLYRDSQCVVAVRCMDSSTLTSGSSAVQ